MRPHCRASREVIIRHAHRQLRRNGRIAMIAPMPLQV
jgi:hypothetical protein